jgi:2-phosphosulfolactate phosphatase
VARAVEGADRVVLLCAGREGRFSLDDALCAGHLVRIVQGDRDLAMNDASQAAAAWAGFRKPTRKLLETTEGGRALVEIGLGDDLDVCAEVDRHQIVAEMRNQAIVRAGE